MENYERLVVFVDGANLNGSLRRMGWQMDFVKFLKWVRADWDLLRVYYYFALSSDPDQYDKQHKFLDWLRYNGLEVVTKLERSFEGGGKSRNDLCVEIATDAMQLRSSVDAMMIVSGNGDFSYLVNKLKYSGIRVNVLSTKVDGMLSEELRKEADTVFLLEDLGDQLSKDVSENKADV